MVVKVSFFDAVSGAPNYSAPEFVEFFEDLRIAGVRNKAGGLLLVSAQSPAAMAVNVAAGWAFSSVGGGGYGLKSDGVVSLTIGSNGSGSTRIDSVVAEIDISNRSGTLKVLPGTPGGGAPALTNNTILRQVELCRVTVANGAVSIVSGNLQDMRVDAAPNVTLSGLATILDDKLFWI